MVRVRHGTWLVLCVIAWLAPTVMAEPRPFLFSMGRYTAAWAGRPSSYDQQLWDHMVTIGATMDGSGLAWCDGEPTQGQYKQSAFDAADFEVDQMRARGIEPTFFLGLTPAWAALRPDLPPHQTPPAEDYVQQFMDFHRYVANHFKGRVKYYYFWNEPNGCSWINGCSNGDSYPLYTKWLKRCSQAVKEADPSAKIIAANLDYHTGVTNGYQYVEGMYNEGAGPYFDIISIHPYDSAGTIFWKAITDTRNVMVAHGDSAKPIWISEFGWNSTDYALTASKLTQVLTELKKEQYSYVQMAQYLVLNGVNELDNYGLMDANLNPRAGYYAFRDFDKSWSDSASFQADVTAGVAPLSVQFTDQSYVTGASGWSWEFGDGQTSTTRNPSHIYTGAGTYSVRLTVTGTGGPQSVQKLNYITVTPGAVDFSADVTAGAAPLTVQFTDHTTLGGVSAWLWDFGDGATSTARNPLYTYSTEGSFKVRLTVTTTGGPQMVEKQGFIRAGSFPKVAYLGEAESWNVADSQIIDRLRSLGLLVDTYDDERAKRPAAAQIASTHSLVIASSTVVSAEVGGDFRSQAVPYIYWESSLSWNGREGLAGVNSMVGGQTQINVINNTHPVMAGLPTGLVTLTTGGADFSWVSAPLASGATVLATLAGDASRATVVVAEPGAALLDGGTAAGKRIFLYMYDTTWTQANEAGKKIFDNAVNYSLGPVAADFVAERTLGATPAVVRFTDQSTGPVTAWAWSFGDGGTSALRHPSHTYAQAGTYGVSLTVSGPGQPATRTRNDYVVIVPRVAADCDGDGDVDADDLAVFEGCASGPSIAHNGSEACRQVDLDRDNDVDQSDFGLFQRCVSGTNVRADPACAD
jgi:PKD repeat protein